MKSIVVNAGSSSVKFQVFDEEKSILSGLCEGIGIEETSQIVLKEDDEKKEIKTYMKNHEDAFEEIKNALVERNLLDGVELVCHRIVHGGEEFSDATLLNEEVLEKLRELIPLAPLHNPANISGVENMMKILPNAKHVGIFDTAFHSTMPEKAYLYGVPYSWYREHKIRRYGFHGSSHQYVIGEAIKELGIENPKIISCHLGNGCSICAAKGGKSIDTSMGFTPLEGLMMGTRSGTIDPAIVTYMMELKKMNHKEIEKILNKDSGLLGLSEIGSDMRVLEDVMDNDERARRAIDIFCHKLIQTIGGYVAELNGVDAIVFTGGIGENDFIVRKIVCESLSYLGLNFDEEKNKNTWKKGSQSEGEISKEDSKVKVLIIPTNEELQMVRSARTIL